MGGRRDKVASGSNVAFLLLKTLSAASESFPPLKSLANITVEIVALVKDFRTNQRDWKEFGIYVQDIIACVVERISIIDLPKDELRQRLDDFLALLREILENVRVLKSQSLVKRIFEWTKDPQEIDSMRRKLGESANLLQLDLSIATYTGLNKLSQSLRVEDIGKVLEAANRRLMNKIGASYFVLLLQPYPQKSQVLSSSLEKLPYVKNASWNKNRACLAGTRTPLIEQVMAWTKENCSKEASQVFLLTGVAGSGKTSIAHSIAQLCFEQKMLLTSFFFDGLTAGLNVPDGFITTLARDLGRVSPDIAEAIAFAIEDDPALSLAHSIPHQFQKLIVEPLRAHPVDEPLVVVIDALDEGSNKDFLTILREDIFHLPSTIRIFLTSRPDDNILRYLVSQPSQFQQHFIDIHTASSNDDILTYIRYSLRGIAARLKLGDWPTDDLVEALAARSQGLFIWTSTVINYIEGSFSPEDALQSILSDNTAGLAPGKKMDSLYANILSRCNWEDIGFVKGYGLLMGTIMTLRTPLSLSAIQALHSAPDARLIARILDSTLGSLLPTPTDPSGPLQVLHLSLREFVTMRASPPYLIEEKDHSQRLALSCLRTLNKFFNDGIPGTGYLVDTELGLDEYLSVPNVPSNSIPEETWYACRFWTEHLLDVQLPSEELQSLLAPFLNQNIVHWVEVMISVGRYQRWFPVWRWMKNNLSIMLVDINFETNFSRSVHFASIYLSGMGRLEEALESILEAAELRRSLFMRNPNRYTPELSSSLNVLSLRLADVGQHTEALKVCREAVTLRRDLLQQTPDSEFYGLDLARVLTNQSVLLTFHGNLDAAFDSVQEASQLYQKLADCNISPEFQWDHAKSLNNLSLRLSDLGRRGEALEVVQQSVALFRQYCDASPSLSKSTLAMSLNNLSNCLSSVGRHFEALDVMQESADMYRQLVNEHPIGFSGDLAMSLSNLSSRLLEIGDNEKALTAAVEASGLYRKLVERHPAKYNLQFAKVLNNQSNVLSALDRQDEALTTIEESVKIYRKFPNLSLVYKSDFAKALNNLSSCLSESGEGELAITPLFEAIRMSEVDDTGRSQSSDLPKAELAMSFNNLSSIYANTDQQDKALDAAQRAVELYQELDAEHPASYRPQLATALYNVSEYHCEAGRHSEALIVIEQAISIYHVLVSELPAVHSSDLDDALKIRARCLDEKKE
ncbi:hypothetical protein VKT23_009342 [Stygiomarasmius scandens]|uniref:Nephrocystin 3-like N-terminal domain-containing protein n=1 Tax=Marasmiellus scandens TaxID=2682957 RepID=A0ABR1JJC3_9AGAR